MDIIGECMDGNVDLELVKEFLKNVEDPSLSRNFLIRFASREGFREIVGLLLQDTRVNPTAEDNEAIMVASSHGHADIVELLLKDGRADPTTDDNWPICEASKYGYTNVVKLLLEDGRVDPTADDNWAIRYAATDEIKEMLIRYKYRTDGPEYRQMVRQIEN